MNPTTRIQLILFLLLKAASGYKYKELFRPQQDEYNTAILNPETLYGAPYGGFARAASSRLAKLPLLLSFGLDEVDIRNSSMDTSVQKSEEEVDDEGSVDSPMSSEEIPSQYYLVTDNTGRTFTCHTYLETELTLSSTAQSMFDMPILKNPPPTPEEEPEEEPPEQKTKQVGNKLEHISPTGEIITINLTTLKTIMDTLKNTCTAIHQGWWSYEYCFHNRVKQFHVDWSASRNKEELNNEPSSSSSLSPSSSPYNKWTSLNVDPVILLGTYEKHTIRYDADKDGLWLEEQYIDGDSCTVQKCSPNGGHDVACLGQTKPRKVTAEVKCCTSYMDNEKWKKRFVSGTHLILLGIEEQEECSYKAKVCSPLLCQTFYNEDVDHSLFTTSGTRNEKQLSTHTPKHSIRDTLNRALSGRCFHRNSGWWTYEFCYGVHAREFHAQTLMDTDTGRTRTIIESEHKLGMYSKPTEKEDSMLHRVDSGVGKASPESVYYEHEYAHGERCLHPDVTEATIGGNPEGIERSTTVRFFCGQAMSLLSVNEDSTCHYVMDVAVPELCLHKEFQTGEDEVKEKYVVKCLPVLT